MHGLNITKIVLLFFLIIIINSCVSQDQIDVTFDNDPFDDTLLPVTFDLRNTGRLPAVKTQPPSGCWASAANGSLESFRLLENKDHISI